MRNQELGMRNEQNRTKWEANAKRRKHRAKRAKGPGARPWSGSRGETHCRVQGQSPQRSLRQSLNRRKPTKRCRKEKEETQTKTNHKAVSECKTLHRFFYILIQSNPRKERSDFAAQQSSAELQGTAPSTSRFGEFQGLNCYEVE